MSTLAHLPAWLSYCAYMFLPTDSCLASQMSLVTDSTTLSLLLTSSLPMGRVSTFQIMAHVDRLRFMTIMPDVFAEDPIPLNRPGDFDIQKWLKGEYNEKKAAHLPPQVDPVVDACIIELREKYGCKKVGAVGYCFGGKYVVRHLQDGKFDAGFTAHPSFVEEAELKDMRGPLSIAAAETDQVGQSKS